MNQNYRRRVAVVGSGLMGHGIAQVLALAGHSIAVHDNDESSLNSVLARVERNLSELAQWGIVDRSRAAAALDRISISYDLASAVSNAEFVFEAIWENRDAKRYLFQEFERLCPPETILASNSSSLMPSLLQVGSEHPERILVAHFFNPPYLVPLVEVVKGEHTSDHALRQVHELLLEAGKSPVIVRRETPGFLANRMQLALIREAIHLVEDGIASPEDVDLAVQAGFGRRLCVTGPLAISESIGWDLADVILETILPTLDSRVTAGPLVKRMVERGELGMKTGQGLFRWSNDSSEAWRSGVARALAELECNDAFRKVAAVQAGFEFGSASAAVDKETN